MFERQTDRQTDRQAGRQKNRQTDRQTDRETETETRTETETEGLLFLVMYLGRPKLCHRLNRSDCQVSISQTCIERVRGTSRWNHPLCHASRVKVCSHYDVDRMRIAIRIRSTRIESGSTRSHCYKTDADQGTRDRLLSREKHMYNTECDRDNGNGFVDSSGCCVAGLPATLQASSH